MNLFILIHLILSETKGNSRNKSYKPGNISSGMAYVCSQNIQRVYYTKDIKSNRYEMDEISQVNKTIVKIYS